MTFSARRLDTGSSVPIETPYQRAKQVWDNRIGDAYAHARNWRLMAFCMAGVSCIFAAGFVYEATRTTITAYYVPISEIGKPGKVVVAGNSYTPSAGAITYFLSEWVRDMFSRPLDSIVLRDNMASGFNVLTGKAFTTMTEWANQNDPMKDVGRVARTVTVNQILQRTDQTWEVDWTEVTFTDGAKSGSARYTGLFSVEASPPTDQAKFLANPIGLHINSITWSREGTSP
jgi:type IV secretory pathway TrbF-like protein